MHRNLPTGGVRDVLLSLPLHTLLSVGFATPLAFASAITSVDLATIKVVGGTSSGVSISPSGRYVAYEMHQARPSDNTYVNQWLLIDRFTRQERVIVQDAGEAMLNYGEGIGDGDDYHDDFAVLSPVWTAHDRAFYYVRKDKGTVSLHCLTLSGGDSVVPTPDGKITDLQRLNDRQAVVTIETSTTQTKRTSTERLRDGLLFTGNEFSPMDGDSSLAQAFRPTERIEYTLDLIDGRLTDFEASPRADYGITPEKPFSFHLDLRPSSEFPRAAISVQERPFQSPDGKMVAWKGYIQDARPDVDFSEEVRGAALFISPAAAPKRLNRVSPLLANVMLAPTIIAWSRDSRHLYFVQPDGEMRSNIFVADARSGQSRQLTNSSWLLDSCDVALESERPVAACTAESLLEPREVVAVDLRTGTIDTLTHLNPEYNARSKARVKGLMWRNRFGEEHFGVLTYPLDYRAGRRYPLVVTHYYHPGFQAGSNGDEYPIQVLAAAGFFVLDYLNFTKMPVERKDGDTLSDQYAHAVESKLSAIEDIVTALARQGLVDEHSVGVCGLSMGSAFASHAISHSQLFRSAIIDHLAYDPMWLFYLTPQFMRDSYAKQGMSPGQPENWKRQLVAPNAADINAALLINTDDHEYLTVLETYWAMRDNKKAVEMWIFSDEHHAKWQPVHRLAIYERNVDWFRFWLQGYEDQSVAKTDQYSRWRALRKLQGAQNAEGAKTIEERSAAHRIAYGGRAH